MIICRRATYFTDLVMTEYYQKMCDGNSKSLKNKNYIRNHARYSVLKNYFLWFALGHMIGKIYKKMIVKFIYVL